MANYAQQLHILQEAMLEPCEEATLPWIATHHATFASGARLHVYTSGYSQRMADAVQMDFPALQHLLGEAPLRAIIEAYVRVTPSSYWDMNRYPLALPHFMHSHDMPADVCALAMLEATIADVFWSPTSPPLTSNMIATLDEDTFGAMQVQLRRDVRLLHLPYNAEAYLAAFRANTPVSSLMAEECYLVIVRHRHEVVRLPIDSLHFTLLQQFHTPCSFNDAFAAIEDAEQLARYLPHYMAQWLEYGILSMCV